jgi:hypothetical protein
MARIRRAAPICAALTMLIGTAVRAQPEGDAAKPEAEAGIAAYVGGKAITMADVDAKALGTDMKLAQTLYEARQRALDQIIMEQLLAKEAAAESLTLDALISKRIAEKTTAVTDEEVEAFYNANRSRMRGQTLEAMSGRIREYLASQRSSTARQSLLDELKEKSDVRITLEPPRVTVVIAANDPAWGPSSAKVTIVEYVDFQ